MPPKKAPTKPGASNPLAEEDLSDVATLPELNQFVFTNLYAFKYKKNLRKLEQAIFKEFYFAPEGETAEQHKRNRVIQQSDILTQAKGKQYLTEDECTNIDDLDAVKKQQVFARCTNELLCNLIVSMRRQKLDEQDKAINEELKMKEEDRLEAEKTRKVKESELDLTVYLKDFPATLADYQEMRRSAKQHLPQFEVAALQGVFLIEEDFKVVYDDEDEPQQFGRRDSTIDHKEEEEREAKKAEQEFTKDVRISAFNDLQGFNKLARRADKDSQLMFLEPQKLKFSGPDPPLEEPTLLEPSAETTTTAPAAGKKAAKEEVPVEPQKTEEELAEEKMFNDFVANFRQAVTELAADVIEYKALQNEETGPTKIPLYPKIWTKEELLALHKAEEEMKKKLEAEEEAKRKAEEEAAAAAKAPKKGASRGKAAAKPDSKGRPGSRDKNASRAGLASQKSERSTSSRPATSKLEKYKEEQRLRSVDDDPKQWNFAAFNKAMSEMKCEDTTVGSILAAIMHQIEQANNKPKPHNFARDVVSSSVGHTSQMSAGVDESIKQKEEFAEELDDITQKLTFEQTVEQSDLKQGSQMNRISENLSHNPYQILHNANDLIDIKDDKYTFPTGIRQGKTEYATLEKMEMPGINDRFGMPNRATRKVYEREADTAVIRTAPFLKLPEHQSQRLITLKAFEDLLKRENPEREYDFLDRNFEEHFDASQFRQVLSNAMRANPDINTTYFDKEDALLLAVNFKNPPGRLLRRQWTYGMKVMPDFATWRKFVKGEGIELPKEVLHIDSNKVGLLRTNQKYAYPCDDSIIRVDKNYVGGKRVGANIIQKDNLIFGIKESENTVFNKVQGQDELYNLEARKASDRRCDFWMEFENGVRLHVEMQDEPTTDESLIPQQTNKPEDEKYGEKPEERIGSGMSVHFEESREKALESARSKRTAESQMESRPATAESHNRSETQLTDADEEPSKEQDISIAPTIPIDDNYKPNEGSCLTLTFKEGLVVQTLPNGDVKQTIIKNKEFTLAQHDTSIQQIQKSQEVILQNETPMDHHKEQPATPESKKAPIKSEKVLSQASLNKKSSLKSKLTQKQAVTDNSILEPSKPGSEVKAPTPQQDEPKLQSDIQSQSDLPEVEVPEAEEVSRTVTRDGALIRHLADGNQIIYLQDGSITKTNISKGIWTTINSLGVIRERHLNDKFVVDKEARLELIEKIDPESNAKIFIREDGYRKTEYPDRSTYLIMPDQTKILITLTDDEDPDAAIRTTLFSKEGYAPVRLIFDPVKARAGTVIGLGGTDALMGKDSIMERSHGGLVSEVLLPDRSIVQTYLEKQELPGYNKFSTSLIHLVRRDDFSAIKVRQDGEVVVISSNERAYLNDQGKMEEFGVNDYDYFFELFGVASERASGVFTANLEQGRIWTQDEEGNFFMIYANGDSTEKLSVSFNLDQMVEGIDNKEPKSPRVSDGEFIEEECKFLPPPKTVAPPRLFLVRKEGACEFMNREQLEYLFRCQKKDDEVIQRSNEVKIDNETAISHHFMKLVGTFDPTHPAHLDKDTFPKLSQAMLLDEQLITIAKEPSKDRYLWRKIIEYDDLSDKQREDFQKALDMKDRIQERQVEEAERLRVDEPQMADEQVEKQCKIWLRIAKKRGIDVQNLLAPEYKRTQEIDRDEKRQKVLDSLDDYFSPDRDQQSTESEHAVQDDY